MQCAKKKDIKLIEEGYYIYMYVHRHQNLKLKAKTFKIKKAKQLQLNKCVREDKQFLLLKGQTFMTLDG